MGSTDDELPDVEAVERATAESLARSARLIVRIDELLAERRRRLDAADRSIEKAARISRQLEIDLRDAAPRPEATHAADEPASGP